MFFVFMCSWLTARWRARQRGPRRESVQGRAGWRAPPRGGSGTSGPTPRSSGSGRWPAESRRHCVNMPPGTMPTGDIRERSTPAVPGADNRGRSPQSRYRSERYVGRLARYGRRARPNRSPGSGGSCNVARRHRPPPARPSRWPQRVVGVSSRSPPARKHKPYAPQEQGRKPGIST